MKKAMGLMLEFQKRYPEAGKDVLLEELIQAIREEEREIEYVQGKTSNIIFNDLPGPNPSRFIDGEKPISIEEWIDRKTDFGR